MGRLIVTSVRQTNSIPKLSRLSFRYWNIQRARVSHCTERRIDEAPFAQLTRSSESGPRCIREYLEIMNISAIWGGAHRVGFASNEPTGHRVDTLG